MDNIRKNKHFELIFQKNNLDRVHFWSKRNWNILRIVKRGWIQVWGIISRQITKGHPFIYFKLHFRIAFNRNIQILTLARDQDLIYRDFINYDKLIPEPIMKSWLHGPAGKISTFDKISTFFKNDCLWSAILWYSNWSLWPQMTSEMTSYY